MNYETKQIIKTVVPFAIGFAISFLVLSFVNISFDTATWDRVDRVFSVILGWVLGGMLYVRINTTLSI